MSVDSKEMFNKYVQFFPTIGKKLKLMGSGKIKVFGRDEDEIYDSWDALNRIYRLFEVEELVENKPFKYWTYGDPNRYEDIKEAMEKKYVEICGKPIKMDILDFKKTNWVYYIDYDGNFCQSGNDMVISLLKNSSEWIEFKLPIKKLTKEDIAKLIGLRVDQFEIV